LFLLTLPSPRFPLFPYTTLFRSYGLAGFEYLYPNALSGGMRQRAALLRTLLFDTDVILLDEPFGALDAQTKLRMQEWLMQLWSRSEEHTSELQSRVDLVCRLLLE